MTVPVVTLDTFVSSFNSKGWMLIDFSAEWCPPCKVMKPIFESYSEDLELGSISFTNVDVDHDQDLSARYQVSSIPTFILFSLSDDGEITEIKRWIGAQDGLTFKRELLSITAISTVA